MFSICGAQPTIFDARSRFRQAPSIEASLRGGAARWPISIPPPRTKAKCSDQPSASGGVDQPRDAIEPPWFDGHRRGEPERSAVQYHPDLCRQCLQCSQIVPRRIDVIVSNNLDQIDPVEMRKDSRSELRAPAEPKSIVALNYCRTRHNRRLLHRHNPIRTMIRSRRPSSLLSCRHAGSRRNRWPAVPICRTLLPIAWRRW